MPVVDGDGPASRIAAALDQPSAHRDDPGDGIWLEETVAATAPDIREWDLRACWRWADWPDREAVFPGSSAADDGIDAVGVRRSDGGLVAIQCKARKLDDTGTGNAIPKDELDSFGFATAGDEWEERWLITNGNAPPSAPATRTVALSGKTIKVVNITADLEAQAAASATDGDCPHCASDAGPGAVRSKSCMQNEALSESVATLRAHADSTTGGSLKGRARGKIVLPCGTGKTRISLRIVEELCGAGDTAVVLCPSIALVAQLRREYLIHAGLPTRSLSVCSDQTAGHLAEGGAEALPGLGGSKARFSKPAEERHLDALKDDPTLDVSHVSASEIKGGVTTDPAQITDWLASPAGEDRLNVIFGTYQSSHRIGEALLDADAEAKVLVADEAHRTAGLRRTTKADEDKLRDFTVCHDDERFPAVYRVYQTATPRVYDGQTRLSRRGANGWIVRDMDDEATFGVELYRRTYTEAVRNGWLADYRIIALGVNDPALFALANELARRQPKTTKALSAAEFTKGLVLALVLGGATRAETQEFGERPPVVESCIAFLNSVEKSKALSRYANAGSGIPSALSSSSKPPSVLGGRRRSRPSRCTVAAGSPLIRTSRTVMPGLKLITSSPLARVSSEATSRITTSIMSSWPGSIRTVPAMCSMSATSPADASRCTANQCSRTSTPFLASTNRPTMIVAPIPVSTPDPPNRTRRGRSSRGWSAAAAYKSPPDATPLASRCRTVDGSGMGSRKTDAKLPYTVRPTSDDR